MVSLYNSCNFYLILTLIITCTDAADITAARGSAVCLPCTSDLYNNSIVTVTWQKDGRLGNLCHYRLKNGTATKIISCTHRIDETTQPPTLCISGVKTRDAGYYNCTVSRNIPPPTVEKSYKMKLNIEGPPRVIISQMSNTSDCLRLLCELDGLDSAQVKLTWSRNGQSISETTNPLHLCNHDWSEGDIFTCNMRQSSSYTDLSASITITQTHSREVPHEALPFNKYPLIIICGGALTGTLVLIGLVICIYKYKKANSSDAAVVYTNKVYENFSFSTTGQQAQRNVTTQQVECIYEI